MPVTEEDLRLCLLQHLEHTARAPISSDTVGDLAEKLIAACARKNELWFGAAILVVKSFRRSPARRDATRLLMRLAAECELESEK